MTNGRRERAAGRPAIIEPLIQSGDGDAGSSRPLSDRRRLALPCYAAIAAAVVLLLARQRPLTVAGFVVAVPVQTLNAVARRGAWTHVREERRETATPARADTDTATTIVRIGPAFRVVAALFDARPDAPLRAIRQPVRAVIRRACLSLETAARTRAAATQAASADDRVVTACAAAAPHRPRQLFDDCQPAERLTNHRGRS